MNVTSDVETPWRFTADINYKIIIFGLPKKINRTLIEKNCGERNNRRSKMSEKVFYTSDCALNNYTRFHDHLLFLATRVELFNPKVPLSALGRFSDTGIH